MNTTDFYYYYHHYIIIIILSIFFRTYKNLENSETQDLKYDFFFNFYFKMVNTQERML